MQITYGRGRRRPEKNKEQKRGEGIRRQLMQLLFCLVIFLAVFIGKGVWPAQVAQTGEQLLAVMRTNTDFRAVFADLGKALSRQEDLLGELGQFCVSVFAPARDAQHTNPLPQDSVEVLIPDAKADELASYYPAEEPADTEKDVKLNDLTDDAAEIKVGTVLGGNEEQDQEWPQGYSGSWLYLGEMETTVPVRGEITSQFGFRDHPTIGRYAPHGGVDIAASSGTEIGAFAAGQVECVGESKDFGNYLQLRHENGVTTFYAHCKTICVREGQSVQAGQPVAAVGSTGKSTGPHLHFEIRLDGVRLDPMYYIDPAQEV